MREALYAWLAIALFELVQTVRHKPTLSQAAGRFGRLGRWQMWLLVGLVAGLTMHLLWPVFHRDPAPSAEVSLCDEDTEGC